ncbi:MAG: acyl-CoA dehydrogenase, partial [Acidimicrobiales bacterium]|nr:acyl-CoA dehydrogenase [Acidimicrobiales bacterium]
GAEFSALAWVQTMLGARPGTIYAGTSEVQRNIVGDRVLGLPREPRADSGPWNEIGKN